MTSTKEIEDKLAIQELEIRYCHAADFGDIETWVDCFAEDGVLDGSLFTIRGSSALREYISKRTQHVSQTAPEGCEYPIRHMVMNMLIELQGDQASAKCYHLMLQITPGGVEVVTTGVSTDKLEKIEGNWRIRHRNVMPASDKWADRVLPVSFLNSLKGGEIK